MSDRPGPIEVELLALLLSRSDPTSREVYLTSREMAEALGWAQRTVAAALTRLCRPSSDGPGRPIIERFRRYGTRDVAGRIIRIVDPRLRGRTKGGDS